MKIIVKKTKLLRLGINEGEELMLTNKKNDQGNSFTYLVCVISEDGGYSEDIKCRIAKTRVFFFAVEISLGT